MKQREYKPNIMATYCPKKVQKKGCVQPAQKSIVIGMMLKE